MTENVLRFEVDGRDPVILEDRIWEASLQFYPLERGSAAFDYDDDQSLATLYAQNPTMTIQITSPFKVDEESLRATLRPMVGRTVDIQSFRDGVPHFHRRGCVHEVTNSRNRPVTYVYLHDVMSIPD